MADPGQTDRGVLEAIRRGDAAAWTRLVEEYQGRLLRFATARVPQRADAEDIVQDTFASFIKVAKTLQIETSIETYLFGILRNRLVDRLRTRWARSVCLIQDVCRTGTDDGPVEPLAHMAAADPSVSWCVSHGEQRQLQRQALTEALQHLIREFQEARKFRDLKVVEMVFYGQLTSVEIARLLGLDEGLVRVVKHRCLEAIRAEIARCDALKDVSISYSEDLLTDVWEAQRLSCPKRSILHEFLLESLSPEWFDYVDFHLTMMGCHFCRASFKDLQERLTDTQHTQFRQRIVTSTVGFLAEP
jgi:RNA polymerase sigma-70 factor (ECF subfamily)